MKPMVKTDNSHRLIEMIVTSLIALVTVISLAGLSWAIWKFVMVQARENWPEWLRLCGVK